MDSTLLQVLRIEIEKLAEQKASAAHGSWSSPQTRSGKRPMRVSTMLRKEKDGTLTKYTNTVKESALSMMPGGADYSEGPETAPGAAVLDKYRGDIEAAGTTPVLNTKSKVMGVLNLRGQPKKDLSREDTAGANVKREDTRDFTSNDPAPGAGLYDTGPQPVYKTSAADYRARFLQKLALSEHAADLAGLGLMAAGGADRLRSQLKGESGAGVLGEKGQTAADVAGLGVMALPHVSQLLSGKGGKLYAGSVLGGLGALAAPALDSLQARLRSGTGEDPSSKQLMSHKTHDLLDLAGYGTFGALSAKDMAKKPNALDALHLAGYGVLAAPHVENLVRSKESPRVFDGSLRSATDLAGIGMLAAPAAAHLRGH